MALKMGSDCIELFMSGKGIILDFVILLCNLFQALLQSPTLQQ